MSDDRVLAGIMRRVLADGILWLEDRWTNNGERSAYLTDYDEHERVELTAEEEAVVRRVEGRFEMKEAT